MTLEEIPRFVLRAVAVDAAGDRVLPKLLGLHQILVPRVNIRHAVREDERLHAAVTRRREQANQRPVARAEHSNAVCVDERLL